MELAHSDENIENLRRSSGFPHNPRLDSLFAKANQHPDQITYEERNELNAALGLPSIPKTDIHDLIHKRVQEVLEMPSEQRQKMLYQKAGGQFFVDKDNFIGIEGGKVAIPNAEIPEKMTMELFLEKAIVILEKKFPQTKGKLVQNDKVMTLNMSEQDYMNFLRSLSSDFPGIIFESGFKVTSKLDLPEGKDLPSLVKGTFADGKKIFFVQESEYESLNKNGIYDKSQRVDDLLETYFQSNPNRKNDDEMEARKVLTGEYAYITPVIAGIKPACFLYTDDEPQERLAFLKNVLSSSVDFAVVESANNNVLIAYNPHAVRKTVEKNSDIFQPLGINDQMSPSKIISMVLSDQAFSGTQEENTRKETAVGMLLGFDKNSVVKWAKQRFDVTQQGNATNKNPSFNNIWGTSYRVADYNDASYKTTKMQYDKLLDRIESLLHQGMSPMDVLKNISKIE